MKTSRINRILTNPLRVEMLSLLAFHDLTENELAKMLKVGKKQVRKQIMVLKAAGAICWKATGSQVYYKIRDLELGQRSVLLYTWWADNLAAGASSA